MKNYNILMQDTEGDEAWTQCEGKTEAEAKVIAKQRWGRGWRAVLATPAKPFYQVLNVGTDSDEQRKQENRAANIEKLSNLNKRVVITPDGEFSSLKAVAEHYKIATTTVRQRIRNHPEKYYYKDSK